MMSEEKTMRNFLRGIVDSYSCSRKQSIWKCTHKLIGRYSLVDFEECAKSKGNNEIRKYLVPGVYMREKKITYSFSYSLRSNDCDVVMDRELRMTYHRDPVDIAYVLFIEIIAE